MALFLGTDRRKGRCVGVGIFDRHDRVAVGLRFAVVVLGILAVGIRGAVSPGGVGVGVGVGVAIMGPELRRRPLLALVPAHEEPSDGHGDHRGNEDEQNRECGPGGDLEEESLLGEFELRNAAQDPADCARDESAENGRLEPDHREVGAVFGLGEVSAVSDAVDAAPDCCDHHDHRE